MTSINHAVSQYINAGLSPVPLENQSKSPVWRAWAALSFFQEAAEALTDRKAVGVVCGFSGIVVIDIDGGGWEVRRRVESMFGKPFAVTMRRGEDDQPVERWKLFYRQALPDLSPELVRLAKAHFGHGKAFKGTRKEWQKERKRTHQPLIAAQRAFIAEHGLIETEAFKGLLDESIEVKSFGAQAVVPPSIHKSGMPVEWEGGTPPTADDIASSVPITRDMISALRKEVTAQGPQEQRQGEREWTGPAPNPELVRSALRAVPNNDTL